MAEINIINSSKLMFHNRIDAEFYRPSYLKIYSKLKELSKSFEVIKLPHFLIIPVRTGSTPNPNERIPLLDGTDVMFIKTDSVRKGYINYESTDLLPLREHKKRSATSLRENDIVLTVVGATHEIIGRAALYLKKSKANINQSDAVIRVDSKKIEPGYLSTFINSKYGRTQLWRYSGQTGQVTMNCREVEEILIPLISKKIREKINKMVLESENLREESKKIYKKAENMLLEILNFKNVRTNKKSISIKKFLSIKENNRFDAEYYDRGCESILKKINSSKDKIFTIKKENIKTKNFFPKENINYNYIELSNINSSIGIIESHTKEDGKNLPTRARRLVREGDVIISSIEGSLKKSALITKDYDKSICSTGFFVLDLKNFYYPEFTLLLMKSKIFQKLLKRGCSGTILTSISKEELIKIPLPKIEKKKQVEIAKLLKKSNLLYNNSKKLLEDSKKKIEDFIENAI